MLLDRGARLLDVQTDPIPKLLVPDRSATPTSRKASTAGTTAQQGEARSESRTMREREHS
ncbi:hypothetical protein D7193_09595 [Micromonospora costi]|uniref:Uncharacterized protein n=1 Tax=Micromonospora costi TaxID=1530042 RepID=A0A3B0AHX0_9ACTN|nr:hypothetical protein D7193_09595 [Micromonospora costi]